MWKIKGIAASAGIAIGEIMHMQEAVHDFCRQVDASQTPAEKERFYSAQQAAEKELEILQERTAATMGEQQAEVFAAHKLMVTDPSFVEVVLNHLDNQASAEAAVEDAANEIAAMFAGLDSEYMQERAADIKDIGKRLVRILQGGTAEVNYTGILAAQDLLPSDTAALDLNCVSGFITALGGKTSHSSILARAAGIPAVVGVGSALEKLKNGDTVVVDGHVGEVLVNPEEDVLSDYRLRIKNEQERAALLASVGHLPSETTDGHHIELACNIGTPGDMEKVIAAGAEGVGLFRTEFLFLDKTSVPTEEEQVESYKAVLAAMPDKKIVIRTLDAGGDKQLPFIGGLPEANPALGLRAIRLCMVYQDVFKTQLRALLRASVAGNLHIMFPMIATVDELLNAKALLKEAAEELTQEGVPFKSDVAVGIMVEVPAAAAIADILAEEVDFFSIGTNDLVQYTMAADRMNEHVAYLSDYFQPPVVRLIGNVAKAAKKAGKWVGMCGEMAGDPLATPLLVGLGLTELSMNGRAVPVVKHRIRQLDIKQTEKWADDILGLRTAADIKKRLEEIASAYEI
ncbi:phosphoenolpyruvate--protein phosphotransferase [Pelosinus propionicus]|uniref:Phosphoenolpyruvate-protein phosphotransferase n=1 Tax=Pelosinus propionicus DSM 13327 TaxID=1123291 RepID=A0A1I4NC77_9FIRM|nr:phosphoenolpyruvate--protein phosphotransferase [Pelosinus propionicus]SFM13124.1 phosphotransferase system, enzyme I, PtsI [Pelosinus propionicus DSM 13327]